MSYDPVVREHQEWLGFLQPVGLVVSPTALKNAQARIARNVTSEQEILVRHTHEAADSQRGAENRYVRRRLNRFTEFAKEFWGWEDADLATPPDNLSTALQEYGEILRPDLAVPGVKGESEWQILIQELPPSHTMDQGGQTTDERSWQASPQARFERLLRDTGIPIGLLVNPDAIRLVYAPRGETAGHVTFPIQAMCETAGRPMVAALHLLLDAQRLFAVPKDQRLPAILQASRKYQNEVSIQLAGQVLRALNELCRGFNEANRNTGGTLLEQALIEAPEEIYGGLLTTLMRLVFLLYAEDRNLMASDETYQRCYGLIGLHEKLREDAAGYPDTMDQRFGAWAQLLTLSRLVHDGGGHGHWRLPARRGRLFDPDCYPFLEGRPYKSKRSRDEKLTPPKVSDGVLYRVLEDLLYLDGERISYRALDVEQIGSVYEAMMGFEVKQADGPSIGFKPDHVVINLVTLLEQAPGDRKKWLKENAGWEPAEKAAQALKAADSVESMLGALNSRVSPLYADRERGTLRIAPGDIFLQPTEERRRSGSHYTPRTLTEPIVGTTLDPVLQQLGENPTPEQILNLKVCDPAMGSGAFLVEACRYLGDALVKAWAAHKATPEIPADQDPLLHARRIVAQRCLYGVDKNPFAVDLAKLSLWLATFAKDHPFTFLDHSFRHGDSLVGLSVKEIVDALGDGSTLFRPLAEARVAEALKARRSILDAVETTPYDLLETKYQLAVQSVGTLRDLGDAVIAGFFLQEKPKDRARHRNELVNAFEASQFDVVAEGVNALRRGRHRINPFHWQTEFPEVFANGGFDAIIGNPPFLGGKRISTELGESFRDWLGETFPESNSNSDLVSFFFRRAFALLNRHGTFGLIATNTISQGKTRATGLRFIRKHGGTIFNARKRVRWPGQAAVVVCIVHVAREWPHDQCFLDNRPVSLITAFLVEKGGDDDPRPLAENAGRGFNGCFLRGMGFTFDDLSGEGHPLPLMKKLIERNPRNGERIFPFLGGDEVNDDPVHAYFRYAINFGSMSIEEAEQWPDLLTLLRDSVLPAREKMGREALSLPWWQFWRPRPEMTASIAHLNRILVCSQTGKYVSFAFIPPTWIPSHKLNVLAFDEMCAFAVLQSRAHEIWARFFGATMKDDPCYFPSDCFETFPFPPDWKENEALERIGEEYYQFRAELMIRNNEGLTKTYNRFHDKYEDNTDIQKLRDLHARMDRAVLDVYGWTELLPEHDFILDYEEPEEDEGGGRRKRKEPWRYRWTDEFRDDVLARLLDLNRERAEEEKMAAAVAQPVTKVAKTTANRSRKKKDGQTAAMFTEETE
jgi:hypothetical protein